MISWVKALSQATCFLAFAVDQGGSVVSACENLGVKVIKCNAHRLSSATIWALGMADGEKTCNNKPVAKLVERLAVCVGVFSHSAANKDALKEIQAVQEGSTIISQLTRRNDTRYFPHVLGFDCGLNYYLIFVVRFLLSFFFYCGVLIWYLNS